MNCGYEKNQTDKYFSKSHAPYVFIEDEKKVFLDGVSGIPRYTGYESSLRKHLRKIKFLG